MPGSMNELERNIATITSDLRNLTDNFKEFKSDTKKLIEKVDIVEAKGIATSERVSNVAVFQGIFSVVIGAIAAYLGVSRK